MSTNSLNENNSWKKLSFVECGNNYSINLHTAEIRNDITDNILKPTLVKGYKYVCLYLNSKRKHYLVHQLVYKAYYGDYDSTMFVIDHINHIRTDNDISNLRLVSYSLICTNISQMNNKKFEYKSELPNAYIINAECQVYYCKQFNKFYRKIADNQYRELREYKQTHNNGYFIQWRLNNKKYCFTTTHFRESLAI